MIKFGTFPKGIHPHANKELSKDAAIEIMPAPKTLYVPFLQHSGVPATPLVKAGDAVKKGQKIGAAAEKGFSAHIFSPVSGRVVSVEKRPTAAGLNVNHAVIENDGKDEAVTLPVLSAPTAEQIKVRAAEAGIVGMGGAGFPTAVKLNPPLRIDAYIINAAECEPYITCDYRLIIEKTGELVRGALYLAKAVNLGKVYIGIEDNKPEAVEALIKFITENNLTERVEVAVLKTKYPQGGERQLIYAVTKRTVPAGGLPCDIGVIVSNAHTAYSLCLAVENGEPCTGRVVTVTGGGIKTPKNVCVPCGTTYSDLIEYCGGASENAVKLINGGPMTGTAVVGANFSVTKTTGCLLLLDKDESPREEGSTCINCAKCATVCPMRLMPMYIESCFLSGDYKNADKYGASDCIECGCCSYVCPAKRWLVRNIRLAKKSVKRVKG